MAKINYQRLLRYTYRRTHPLRSLYIIYTADTIGHMAGHDRAYGWIRSGRHVQAYGGRDRDFFSI
jgi:hypothetical protein